MSIAPTLQRYLDHKSIEYDLIAHAPTTSSAPTAEACHISGDRLAKAVVVRTRNGYVLAVLPASHHIRSPDLKTQLGEDYRLANEHELDQLFQDCAPGAVPPVGECYGLDVVVEDSIREQPEVYLEGGDHVTLVHMSQAQFGRLVEGAPHGHFSVRP
jgi:Ala-tRNA(Pro) deacylase